MNPVKSPLPVDATEEVSALIEALHETGQGLEELTAGELDTVADRDGRTVLLRGAQDPLRLSETAKQATILIVDDEIRNCKLLETLLRPEGYLTLCAANGEEALASIALRAPDLILLDIMMPGMDGYQVATIVKANPATSNIPIIMVTVKDDRSARLAGLDAGAEEFLTKPVDRAELWLRVRNLLRLKAYGDFLQNHGVILEQQVQARTADLQRFRAAMEISGDAILLIDRASMRYIDVNQTLCDLVGRTRQELLGMTPMDVFGANREILERDYDAIIADNNSSAAKIEGHYRHKDGSLIPIETRRRALHTGGGWIIVGTSRDITERKQADEKIRRLNRVYAVLSGINSAIMRIRNREDLFSEACRIAVDAGKFLCAWVGLLDPETGKINPVASAGDDRGFLKLIRFTKDSKAPAGPSFIAETLRTGKAMICNDVENDGGRLVYRDALLERGFRALAGLPLVVEGEAVGYVAFYAGEVGFFDDEEARLLDELAGDISFALDHISKEERLNYLAMYDPLTGLANRALFLERLNQFIQAASPVGNKVALVLTDIERFGTINESLGRQAGDAVIKQLAGRLAAEVGKVEVARIGVDHFVIVLQAIKGKSEVTRRIERLWRSCLAEPFRVSGAELRISARAGVTLFPNDGAEAELLLRNAEAALVKAKELGERYVFYTSALTARTGERLTLENRLRQALEKDEFVLHYQPKVELEARRIVGVEALIRWQSPELGLVPPMKFIPLMEETGLILDVGAWVLDKAIEDHLQWIKLGLPAPRVAVNVSPIQLRRRDFYSTVEAALKRGTTPPGVDLEITESLIMEDIESTMQKLKEVRDLGVSIAIDDFGTGYSSLGYLARLPVQTLKIDRSFIITMLKDSDTMTLVRTIISLAHSLRLKVVAEGVDEEEQAKMLRLLRCDEMQGYLFSKPIPFAQMTALLKQGKQA